MNPLFVFNLDLSVRGPVDLARGRVLAVLLAVMFLSPAILVAQSEIDETRPMAPDGNVSVENQFGEISVEGWERDEVRISGYLSDDVKELEIRESGNGLRIRVEYYDRRSIDGASLELVVPKSASVEASSVSGDIDVAGLEGDLLDLNTVSGDLVADATVGRLTMNSVSGDVEFTGSASRAEVESVSGEVELLGVKGELEVTTVSGDVTVEGGSLRLGEFEAVSGDIELHVALEDGGRINVSSMSGDIGLYLPRDQEAEFFAQTFSGDIDSDFGRVSNAKHGPGSRLEHQEGSNGATINLNSFSGDVTIERR